MITIKIFIAYGDTPPEEFEAYIVQKDWRDVIIEQDGQYYLVEIITLERLECEYRFAVENGETATLDLPTVIADRVAKERIIELLSNVDSWWFDALTPINFDSDYFNTAYSHFARIENLTCIYDSEIVKK